MSRLRLSIKILLLVTSYLLINNNLTAQNNIHWQQQSFDSIGIFQETLTVYFDSPLSSSRISLPRDSVLISQLDYLVNLFSQNKDFVVLVDIHNNYYNRIYCSDAFAGKASSIYRYILKRNIDSRRIQHRKIRKGLSDDISALENRRIEFLIYKLTEE